MDYEAIDNVTLLSVLKIHPKCGSRLQPGPALTAVWGCPTCKETWYLPDTLGLNRVLVERGPCHGME